MTSVHVHRFPCGTAAIEMTQEIGGVRVTECVGPLPDKFRTMNYKPVIHPDLPDGGGSDAGLREFMDALRAASDDDAPAIIAGAVS